MFLFACFACSIKDTDPLITQELVDAINSDPNAPFQAKLYPKFAKMTVGDAKRFLSPVRPSPQNHGSAVPVGANEEFFNTVDRFYLTGLTNVAAWPKMLNASNQVSNLGVKDKDIKPTPDKVRFPVFDVTKLCSSWAPAVTSAMTISVSRWANKFVNFSLQYVLDCDMLGDSCIERTPLNAYQLFWTYHPPDYNSWDKPGDGTNPTSERTNYMDAPRADFTREHCKNDQCYPGTTNCAHYHALTGSCNPGDAETACPIYFLYNWRWIKSHLWEVGAVTSSIVVHDTLFSYERGVYSSKWQSENTQRSNMGVVLGMLDVTIIGWGQTYLNLTSKDDLYSKELQRWWYVIPHFGRDWGMALDICVKVDDNSKAECKDAGDNNANPWIPGLTETSKIMHPKGTVGSVTQAYFVEGAGSQNKGFMQFNRRFDDCNIESHAVGAVPWNFVPLPYRTPSPTNSDI